MWYGCRYLEKGGDGVPGADVLSHSDDDSDAMDQQEQFERKFNFRFEEPDQEFVSLATRNPHVSAFTNLFLQ